MSNIVFGETTIVGNDDFGAGHAAGVDPDNRSFVNTKPSKDNAQVGAFGLPKFSLERTLISYFYTESILQINFIETDIALGRAILPPSSAANTGVLTLSTGAAASSGVIEQTKRVHIQPIGKGMLLRLAIHYVDAPVVGNIRIFGMYDGVDGYFIRLNGLVLEFVTSKASVEIVIAASTWDVPVTPDTDIHLWEIQTKSAGSGDFDIFYDKNLVHSIKNVGTSPDRFSDKNDLPLRLSNENTSNTTDILMEIFPTAIFIEGEESVRVTDGLKTLQLSEDRRALVQQFGNVLMGENFDLPLDTVQRWEETLVGGALVDSPSNTHTLVFSVTTGATDLAEIVFREQNLVQTVGGFASFEIGASFGASLVVDNVREWGYMDESGLNGVFFRLDGTNLQFVTVKGGVETVSSLEESLPNLNFHLYRITQLGAGKIAGFIDGAQLIDFEPAGGSLVGSANKKPFIKMYNNALLGGVPSDSEFHWLNLTDLAGTSTSISGIDENSITRKAQVNSAGELKVEVVPGAPPVAATQVFEIFSDVVSGTDDNFVTITNLKNLTISRFIAGYVQPSSGDSIVELYWAPNGDATGIELLVNKNGSTTSTQTLNISATPGGTPFLGDGTAAILVRRRKTGGGSTEITGAFIGFEI